MAARGEPPLNDIELRNELKRLGYAVGPVTASTRPVLLKKLQRLRDEEKKNSRKTPVNKIASPKIFALSSDESEGEAAGISRGTAPVSAARRRSGPRTPRTASNKTTKRTSLGSKTSHVLRKSGTRRSLAIETPESDDENDVDEYMDVNGQHQEEKSDKSNERENLRNVTPTPLSSTSRSGRKSIRSGRGAGDHRSTGGNGLKDDKNNEFSDSEGEALIQRAAHNRVKKSSTVSRTPGTLNASRSRGSRYNKVADRKPHIAAGEDEEEDDDDSASDNSGKRNSSGAEQEASGTGKGMLNFLTRRTPNSKVRTDSPVAQVPPASDVSKEGDEDASGNWTFFTSRFNSSRSRTSTPRKESSDDTLYHTVIAGNSRQNTSSNSVATPVSGRPALRGSAMNIPPSNHTSFLGQTPPAGTSSGPGGASSSSNLRRELTTNANESQTLCNAQPPLEEFRVAEAQVFATEENLGSSWRTKYGHFVSMVLLGSACLFFVLLGLMYLSVNSTGRSGHLQIADIAGGDNVDFSGDGLPLMMVQALHEKLSIIAGDFVCGKLGMKNMSKAEAEIFLEENVKLDETVKQRRPFWVSEHTPRVHQLIITNPQWGLRLFQESGEHIVEYNYENNVAWMDSSIINMSLFCQVKTTAYKLLFYGSIALVSLLVLLPGFYLIKYQMQKKEQERQDVNQLVERIIEVLANHQQACYVDKNLTPYLAIPHVRDTLIPPAERHKKQHLWQKAVQFLNVNESRVRVETQQVAGEEFAVWRWVQPSPAVAVTSFSPITERDMNPKRAKVWQGTAFANLDTAVKASAYSYTPCLKVRNMFDPTLESGSNWEVTIQDAILERCGEDSGILHIAVDKNSREGCVYVKCVSAEKAGMAFRCLQGSWFDGKLVTVKYIRLDRYHQRFPPSLNIMSLLKPSNNYRLSLQPLPASSS